MGERVGFFVIECNLWLWWKGESLGCYCVIGFGEDYGSWWNFNVGDDL